jgi:hypothetical protein
MNMNRHGAVVLNRFVNRTSDLYVTRKALSHNTDDTLSSHDGSSIERQVSYCD